MWCSHSRSCLDHCFEIESRHRTEIDVESVIGTTSASPGECMEDRSAPNFKERFEQMKKFLLLSAIALLLAGSTEAFAQGRNRDGHYNDRQDRQRVRRGVRSGQITHDEAREIHEREQQIRAERRGYGSDGTISREERREIRSDERQQDRYIRSQRHDNDRRPRYNHDRNEHRRGNGYYHRGAGSRSHPVFVRRHRY